MNYLALAICMAIVGPFVLSYVVAFTLLSQALATIGLS